ncbi:MAG: hybrid sensor histidine kinase/response regulator [Rhodocyclaceae bacterium]|jgi:chemosensory pili system protein ChpA (sensor histidine kinase/response regulator)|nr:hybrid sensor histidine kinase/response regulator [Rhodocyclaceae bacterium]
MAAATDLDLGPLSWVKGEIDLALGRALEALGTFTANPGDSAQLKFAQTHLHQAHGALSIVGLDGVTQFSEAVEQFLAEMEKGQVAATAAAGELAQRALAAIRHYLDEIAGGASNQPLKLLPIYRDLLAARGIERAASSDLFFPDLSQRPPKRGKAEAPLAAGRLKAERARFERGFLKWLRNADDLSGLAEMRDAVAAIEATQSLPAGRAFWWITLGLLDALATRQIPVDFHVKKLCARIDLQMRRLLEGSKTVAERLMRDALYFVAMARGGGEQVQQVRKTYRLEELVPAATADIEPLKPVLRSMREALGSTKEAWNKFCAGAAVALPQFHDNAVNLASRGGGLVNDHLARLAASVAEAAQWLRKDPLRHNDVVAMEIATSLLLAENALENYEQLGADFPRQVEIVVGRLAALMRGESLAALDTPLLDEMSRRAQERLLMSQVAREILTNLAQIEQALDAFFRDAGRRTDLAELSAPLRQVQGALTILGQDKAVDLLRGCEDRIQAFADPEYQPQPGEFEDVAHKLSGLGFFVEALQHGPADLDAILQPVHPKAQTTAEEAVEEADVPSVEAGLEQQKREAQVLAGALREKPEDAGVREDLKQHLEAIRQDASLIADARLEKEAKAALAALEVAPGETAGGHVEEAMARVAPAAPMEVVAPSAETLRLAEAPSEEIDAELLGIFLEEAHEVLATIGEHLGLSRGEPHNHEYLITIRRGFHTLKGSGRMVGLNDLGEAAWAVEQVMNKWLQSEQDATPSLYRLAEDAHALFGEWVAQLESGGGTHKDASALIALAERVKAGEAIAAEAAEAPPTEIAIEAPLPESSAFELEVQAEEAPAATEESGEGSAAEAAEEGITLAPPEPEEAEAAPPAIGEIIPQGDFLRGVEMPAADDSVALGDMVVSRSLYDMYVGEARGHIAALRIDLNALKLASQAPPEVMVRAAHTLAGISGTVGIEPINRLALALEHALERLAHSGLSCSSGQIGLLGTVVSTLEAMVAAVAEQRVPHGADGLAAELDEVARAIHRPAVGLSVVPPAETVAETAPPEISAIGAGAVPEPAALEKPEAAPEIAAAPEAEPAPERRKLRLHDDIDEQLLPIFLEEAVDLIREIGAELRGWHENPADREAANTLARLLHTLKGSARMAGAMGMGELVHSMETRLEEAVAANAVTPGFLEEIDTSYDRANFLLDGLNKRAAGVAEEAAPAAAGAGLAAAPQPERAPAEEIEELAAARAMLRVRADLIDRLVNEAGEMSIARSRIEGEMRTLRQSLLDLTENVIRLRSQLREIEIQAESQMQSQLAQTHETHAEFDPLEFDRFTRFQEITRMMAESVNDVTTVQHALLRNLDHADAAIVSQARQNRELSQALMSVRMVPFNSIADRLYRVVRLTAKELGRKANLDIRGGQVELDRSVLEKMTGPIEHLLRNAITHGMEDRGQRLAAGKQEIGQISLALSQEGNEVVIEMTDDGAGLDYERIRNKAIEQGLLAPDQHPDEATLTNFIFHAGFSTAQELTEIAGRGVGMDVVKAETAELGGRIEAASERGRGARFRVYLPLTLTVAQALLVRVGSRTYAIPSVMVEQVLELKPAAAEKIRADGAAEWLGNRYPYHFLPRLLGDAHSMPEPQRRESILLLRGGAQRISVQVDELRGNQEIVIKNIGPQLARVIGIAGATVLGDGEVVLILNPVALASREFKAAPQPEAPAAPVEAEQPAAALPTVMIVDDSLTVRKIAGRLLSREGYHVLTAKDGVDALEQLLDIVPDVMLVDIEMPRMDGFDLTRNVRADERLKNVPIIMITSRIAEKHRNYAREIGVNHYLGKPYQEDQLLQYIAQYARKPAAITA